MNEMRYTPSVGEVIRPQWETQADFTYSILGNVISIKRASFFALRETDEQQARRKLLDRH
jgi:hypothetical protein